MFQYITSRAKQLYREYVVNTCIHKHIFFIIHFPDTAYYIILFQSYNTLDLYSHLVVACL